MGKTYKNILKVIISLSIGIFIFWWAYKDLDKTTILEILKNDVRYGYIGVAIVIGIFAHYLRAVRWKMQIDALDEQQPTKLNTFFAVMIGYFVNFLIPRGGEVVRCGIINRYHKIAFTKVLGTMIAERAFDFISLIVLILLTILMQMGAFTEFFADKPFSLAYYKTIFWVVGIILLLVVLFFVFRKQLKSTYAYGRVAAILADIGKGIKMSLRLKKRYLFFVYTIGIWTCYFLMVYIPIFAFDFTSHLSIPAVFFVFILGSFGTALPVPGGLGTWNALTMAGLMLFGVGETEAGTYALVVYTSQMASYMLGGLISFVMLPLVNSSNKSED